MNKKKILVSGTYSGLGKFLYTKIGSHKYKRNMNIRKYNNTNWDVIIHCGFYAGGNVENIDESIQHSLKISLLKSRKFIFI